MDKNQLIEALLDYVEDVREIIPSDADIKQRTSQIVAMARARLAEEKTASPPNSVETEWTRIGEVGVDSGQLMICDPYYLGSQWKDDDESPRIAPSFRHNDGSVLYCSLHGGAPVKDAIAFSHYQEVIPKYGKTANALTDAEEMREIKKDPSGEFSYTGCCEATRSDEQAGQLNYVMGHAGAGVVASSGLGDGSYDVYAKFVDCKGWGRRVAELRVVMLSEDELEEMEEEHATAHTD